MKPAATFLFQVEENSTRHNHEHAQLVLGIRGVSLIEIGELRVVLDRNTGCIIPSEEFHVFSAPGDNLHLTVNFNLEHSTELVKRICEKPRSFRLDRALQTFLEFSAMELPEFQGATDIGRDTFSQQVVAVLISLLSDRFFNDLETEKRIDLNKIDRYLNKRLHRKIGIEALAREANISLSHFYTLFKQQTGATPHRYIVNKRLEKAMLLLRTTHLSITEVAFITGFSSQSALSNAFKKEFSCTPGSVRRGR